MWQRASYLAAGLALTACAAATPSTNSTNWPLASHGREVITATEIVSSRVTDVYQAVVQLRPEFLRRRTMMPMPAFAVVPLNVYLDELPFGGIESLRSIPLDRVRLIRYVSPYDADLRWGGTHPAGAILVTTVK